MSIWGVNQALPAATIATAGSDVNCPAGTETNVITATIPTSTPGFNSNLFIDVAGVVVLGATPPTALVIAVRFGSGVDVDSYTVSSAALVASSILQLAPSFVAALSRSGTGGSGPVNVTVNATGQAVTLKAGARSLYSYQIAVDA